MRLPILFCTIVAICLSLALPPLARSADEAAILVESFESTRFHSAEKRVLQSGLALLGYFGGPINGRWGVASQQAFEDYAAAKFGGQPKNDMIAHLVTDFQKEVGERGWRYEYMTEMNISVAIPSAEMVRSVETDETTKWQHKAGKLFVEFRRHPFDELGRIHARVVSDNEIVTERYELQEEDRWISSAQHVSGDKFYVNSHRAGESWYSLLINAPKDGEPLFNAATASIRQGRIDEWPTLPDDGYAAQIVKLASQQQ